MEPYQLLLPRQAPHVSQSTKIVHGAFSELSTYRVKQLKYFASQCDYFELLLIPDAPLVTSKFIVHWYHPDFGHHVYECRDRIAGKLILESGLCTSMMCGSGLVHQELKNAPGVLHSEHLGRTKPWFYQ